MAEGVISGKGSSLAALPSRRSRQKSSQRKFGDDGRQQFEKQLQGLQWGLKMQRKARSKGEKMWARRQIDRTKKRFAKSWLEELEAKAKVSEVDKETAGWTSTAARNDFEKAKRLLEDKEKIQKKIRRRFKGEVERIEKIDEELQKLRAAAEAESSSEAQVVAAVHDSDGFVKQGARPAGSSIGCERSRERQLELQEQLLAMGCCAGEAEEEQQQAAALVKQQEQELRASSLREVELREKLEEANRRAREAEEEAECKVQQQRQ